MDCPVAIVSLCTWVLPNPPVTHKTEKEEGNGKDLVGVFKVMVRTRVAADFAYYKMTDEFLCFNQRGCIDGVICLVDSTDGISFQF